MSNMLRSYRRSMIRAAAEAKGGKLFRRGSGRKVADEPSRLSAAYHKAMKTKPTYKAPKRGVDARVQKQPAEEKKRGLSSALLDALRRRRAQ